MQICSIRRAIAKFQVLIVSSLYLYPYVTFYKRSWFLFFIKCLTIQVLFFLVNKEEKEKQDKKETKKKKILERTNALLLVLGQHQPAKEGWFQEVVR